jgi:predicted lipoprotein
LAASVAWACTDPTVGGQSGSDIDFDRRALLASVAYEVIAPTFSEFATAADVLAVATEAYAQGIATGSSDAADQQAQARTAFAAAMDAWQRAEVMRLGPAGDSIYAVGGEDLGDAIYSWPTTNTCLIDQMLVELAYEADDFIATSLVNVYGLDALEYLLFGDSTDNTCPGQLPINAGPWDALTEDELARRRAQYAAIVAGHVAFTAQELATAWDPASGDFPMWLAEPAMPGSPYASEAVAIGELLRGIVHVDVVLKDVKIGRPAGITNCNADACPNDLESLWAGRARENAIANLHGLRQMYFGGASATEGIGFDDFLVAAGEQALADAMAADIDAAIAAAEGMPSFAEALAADPSALDPLYASIKRVTDALKGPFATALALQLPNEAAGDVD